MKFSNISELKSFLENNPNINYMDLYENKVFTKLLIDKANLRYVMKDFPIRLIGDIRKIVFYGRDHINIIATISNTPYVLGTYEVKVIVPNHLKDKISDLLTDTGFNFEVLFVDQNTFVLNDIISKNNLLNFPYCICSGDNPNPDAHADICHRVFGYSKSDYSTYCPLCGSNTEMVYNVYDEKFKNFF